ncbi:MULTISPECIES: glycosyltransferase [unclassified Lentimonas]|uniref:glycosyltransferase n=1 Tax=unclassified Lentimonas TaxID=2630993 RepID=UPI00132B2E27|nr:MULTISPECIES: glycosyltransferase [unclassified Lentimonas]CAA6680033.1 Unannotated [Lentimonas sp. CC4]CAA6685152.1 Unannotated [Lentimonas sp. CC6]CAA7075121.1 Unannotated [Lentimonas sp. CC4]CAA7168419.1 Unannotated [Lentimonas sp. CC21]CAA7182146.1 Unannotated [Lentimonas sp. CC8]
MITVITVCFNDFEGLSRTVDSVIAQRKLCELQHIIVDGASTDGTRQYLECASEEGRIDGYVSESDRGIYDAMNKGFSNAQGEWLHFLNAGDIYASDDALSVALSRLRKGVLNYFDLYQWSLKSDGYETKAFIYDRERLNVGCYLMQPATILHRDQVAEVGAFSLEYSIAGDYDYLLRLLKKFPALRHDYVLTKMEPGGVSDVNYVESFRQFRKVSVRHGFPVWKAYVIYILKVVNSTVKRLLK